MRGKRLIIAGRVQNVGFRDWAARTATSLGLAGWVRNRADGTVELLLYGQTDAVEEMQRACRRGPRLAEIDEITEFEAEPPADDGFVVRPGRF